MTAPRHCMVVHSQYPIGETRVQREALTLVDRGFEVEVLCLRSRGEQRHEMIDGVKVHRLPVRRHRGRGMAWQLSEYLMFFVLAGTVLSYKHLRSRYHSVQVHNLPDFLVFCAIVPKLTRTPVVLDIHDLMPEFMAARTDGTMGGLAVRLLMVQERLACRFADQVITVTTEWQATLADRAVSSDRVSVVMNLADPRLFAPAPRDRTVARETWRLLYHGTFSTRYGVDLLVEAVHRLRDDCDDIHLSLLGDGEIRDELADLIESRQLHDVIHMSEGMLDASELHVAIEEADVGIVPNRRDVFTDGILPTKLVELVAVGTPVVAARTRCVERYFTDEMVAYFEPGDAASLADSLRTLHRDRAQLNKLSAAATEFNRQHDWDSAADAYALLIQRLGRHE